MSGGSYDYAFCKLEEFAHSLSERGQCSCASPSLRRAFSAHCEKVAKAMQACEWNDSCDGHDGETQLILDVISPQDVEQSTRERLASILGQLERMAAEVAEVMMFGDEAAKQEE